MPRITENSRGTGPRATVLDIFLPEERPLHRRARACPSPCRGLRKTRGGQAPALRYLTSSCPKNAPFTVGRGPVPRHAAVYRTLAGDRPPRYGNRTVSWQQNGPLHRRARACPSPCRGLPKTRGRQSPRYGIGTVSYRMRGVPRLETFGLSNGSFRSVGPECL